MTPKKYAKNTLNSNKEAYTLMANKNLSVPLSHTQCSDAGRLGFSGKFSE
jgi:hypothetical protein